MAPVDVEGLAEHLVSSLHEWEHGAVRVEDAEARVDQDPEDRVAVYLFVTLNDPSGETWPTADVLALRRWVLRKATEKGADASVYVRLMPHTDQPQEDDEQQELPGD